MYSISVYGMSSTVIRSSFRSFNFQQVTPLTSCYPNDTDRAASFEIVLPKKNTETSNLETSYGIQGIR